MNAEQFIRGAEPRRGTENPTRCDEPVWEWMIRNGGTAWAARDQFGVQDKVAAPTWCFERFGMSCTALDDGRLVCIGGEHEDHYDPDFYIYNDVVVIGPDDGPIEILGYPESDFPATDFHTATRVGNRIIVIGTLGYDEQRQAGTTRVYVLDTESFRFEQLPTSGTGPGWIYEHAASFDPATNSIVVGSGMIDDGERLVRNESTFRLRLDDGRWEELPRAVMRRRFTIEADNVLAEGDMPGALQLNSRPTRALVSMETNVVDYHAADAQGVLIRCEDWGAEYELTIDGLVDDMVAQSIADEIAANLQRRSGAHWTVKVRDEYPEESDMTQDPRPTGRIVQALGSPARVFRRCAPPPVIVVLWVLVGAFLAWDVLLAADDIDGNTWSEVMRESAGRYSVLPWMLGALLAHLFHPRDDLRPVLDVDLASTVMGLVTVGLIVAGLLDCPLPWHMSWTALLGVIAGLLLWPKPRSAGGWQW